MALQQPPIIMTTNLSSWFVRRLKYHETLLRLTNQSCLMSSTVAIQVGSCNVYICILHSASLVLTDALEPICRNSSKIFLIKWALLVKGEEIGSKVIPGNKGITRYEGLSYSLLQVEAILRNLNFSCCVSQPCQKTIKQPFLYDAVFLPGFCLNSMKPTNDKITSDGSSTGAAMFVHHPQPGTAAVAGDCCCINIYVNNNIQGVTNSILFGSKVVMRDPGVRLQFSEDSRRKGKTSSFGLRDKMKISSSIKLEVWILLSLLPVFVFSIISKLILQRVSGVLVLSCCLLVFLWWEVRFLGV